jgi:hypothetical protein
VTHTREDIRQAGVGTGSIVEKLIDFRGAQRVYLTADTSDCRPLRQIEETLYFVVDNMLQVQKVEGVKREWE